MAAMKLRRQHDPKLYLSEVEAFLSDKFTWDDLTRETFRNQTFKLRDYGSIPPQWEFICDEPVAANWRLKANPKAGKWGIRVAFYGRSDVGQRHADDLSRQLKAIHALGSDTGADT